jgi:hypothetical protein
VIDLVMQRFILLKNSIADTRQKIEDLLRIEHKEPQAEVASSEVGGALTMIL